MEGDLDVLPKWFICPADMTVSRYYSKRSVAKFGLMCSFDRIPGTAAERASSSSPSFSMDCSCGCGDHWVLGRERVPLGDCKCGQSNTILTKSDEAVFATFQFPKAITDEEFTWLASSCMGCGTAICGTAAGFSVFERGTLYAVPQPHVVAEGIQSGEEAHEVGKSISSTNVYPRVDRRYLSSRLCIAAD